MTSSETDAFTVAIREDAIDFVADYAEYGEQRWYTRAVAAEDVSFRRRGRAVDLLIATGRASDREAG